MPPTPNKGPGKKNNAGAMARQRSRNTTPSSVPPTSSLPPIEAVDTEYLELRVEKFRNLEYDDVVDPTASAAPIPDSRSLDSMVSKLQRLQETIDRRSAFWDRGMRSVVHIRKNNPGEDERVRTDEDERERRKKKRKANDSLAPGDANTERSSPLRERPRKQSRDNDSASSSLSPVEPSTPNAMDVDDKKKAADNDDDSDSDDGASPPRKELPRSQTFGDDPSTFPDPTVYEILDVEPGMTEEEIREIYSVARYPRSDLADLIAGNPPDKDFSSGKASNQISFSTFSTYVEPFFRPFAEEDLTFLRERGDRSSPFVVPKRGKKHYTETWAEEDGAMVLDSPQHTRVKLPPNQPRGGIENMDDDVAETDKLSVGPLLSRLLQMMRPEARAPPAEDRPMANGATNGDVSMTNGDVNGDAAEGGEDKGSSFPPAAYMADSSTEAWKKASHPKLDYNQVDERVKQELRHIGFMPQEGNVEAEYDAHSDDEVAARLRLLQDRLRDQILVNGARKARLTELVRERMAHQEYQTILEDLDSQVQAAYLKRTRTLGKSKKAKRPGGAGGGSHFVGGGPGMARQGIGDLTKTLMERRRKWIDTIGILFDDQNMGKVPRSSDPDSSIFKAAEMAELTKTERKQWVEEEEMEAED